MFTFVKYFIKIIINNVVYTKASIYTQFRKCIYRHFHKMIFTLALNNKSVYIQVVPKIISPIMFTHLSSKSIGHQGETYHLIADHQGRRKLTHSPHLGWDETLSMS